jgi:hypothetical protein
MLLTITQSLPSRTAISSALSMPSTLRSAPPAWVASSKAAAAAVIFLVVLDMKLSVGFSRCAGSPGSRPKCKSTKFGPFDRTLIKIGDCFALHFDVSHPPGE